MTWKEMRTVRMLLIIAAVLFSALLIVFGMRYRENRQEALDGGKDSVPTGLADSGVPADPGAYSALRYYNGSVTLSFELDEKGKWIWADGPDFPLNDANLNDILSALSGLKFQQVLSATQTKEEYGLDDPAASITATGGGTEQNLIFGKTTTDGNSYYMMMNGDESTVYIVADTLVNLMRQPIYDMSLPPEMPDLSEDNLRAITIQGPAPEAEPSDDEDEGEAEAPPRPTVSLTARRSNGDDQPAMWFDGGDNVTSAPLMQDLLHDLRVMTMSKCVDYYPSDEALEICGFDNPNAILKVEYASAGLDETFTMEVGARMPDESGRYVRLGGDGAVYALGTDSVDALMTISASGIRAAVQSAEPADDGADNGEA